MRSTTVILLIALLSTSLGCQSYKDIMQVTDLKTQSTFNIKRGDHFQCRYKLFNDNQILVEGIVKNVNDSTLIYKRNSLTPANRIFIRDIYNIDKINIGRGILPTLLLSSAASGTLLLIGPKKSPTYSGILTVLPIAAVTTYIYKINHRHLDKNVVGKTVRLDVFHRDANGELIIPPVYNNQDTTNVYYRK